MVIYLLNVIHIISTVTKPKSVASSSWSAILQKNLKSFGMKIRKDVPGDGSCFFHALIDQFGRFKPYDNVYDSQSLRQSAVDYFENLVSIILLSLYNLNDLC